MKRVTSSILMSFFAALLFSFSACTSESQTQEQTDNSNEVATATAATDISKTQAQQILTSYLQLKDALVQTDGVAANQAASQLVSTLGESKDELLGKIRTDAEHIVESEDPKLQRDYFNALSQNVYDMMKTTEANESPIYRQYCPMAFDGKGAFWLAAEKEVNNPYFGDMMLHCGKVEEEL